MERKRRGVKRTRKYDSSGRSAQAAKSRASVLEVAERLFLAHGYSATTVASIASEAGVSVETIYKAFGGKSGLVRGIRDWRLQGAGPIPAEARSDRLRAHFTDPYELIARWGTLTAEVAPLVAPILLLMRAAALGDGDVATLLSEMDADRLRRMTTNARHLHDAGQLRAGVSLAQAADVLWTYSSPELYELLVQRRGWTADRYGRFVADAMCSALLPPRTRRRSSSLGQQRE